MDYKEEQNGEIEALLSIYEGEIEGKLRDIFQFDHISIIVLPFHFYIVKLINYLFSPRREPVSCFYNANQN